VGQLTRLTPPIAGESGGFCVRVAQLSLPRGAGGCIVLRDETSGDNRKTTIESRPNGVPSHRHMHGQITYNNGRAQFRSVHIQQREGQRRAPVTGCLQEGGPELHIPRISAQITHTTIHQPGMRCWGLVLYPWRLGTLISAADARYQGSVPRSHTPQYINQGCGAGGWSYIHGV